MTVLAFQSTCCFIKQKILAPNSTRSFCQVTKIMQAWQCYQHKLDYLGSARLLVNMLFCQATRTWTLTVLGHFVKHQQLGKPGSATKANWTIMAVLAFSQLTVLSSNKTLIPYSVR